MQLNVIWNTDCVQGMRTLIPESSIDLCITSPPYNISKDYGIYKDNLPWDIYLAWCDNWLYQIYRVLKDDGRLCLNVLMDLKAQYDERKLPIVDFINLLRGNGYKIHGLIIWEDSHRHKNTAWGSFTSCSSPFIFIPYECIIVAYKNSWKKLHQGISDINSEEFIDWVKAIWKIRPETDFQECCPFPVELPTRCIKLLSWIGDIILDPFSGVGTTCLAAKRTNRNYIGFEIEPKFIEISKMRLSQEFLI